MKEWLAGCIGMVSVLYEWLTTGVARNNNAIFGVTMLASQLYMLRRSWHDDILAPILAHLYPAVKEVKISSAILTTT